MVAEHRPAAALNPPSTPAAVLAAWLGDLNTMVHQHIAALSAEELAFQPDPQGNSIGVTVWHFSRWLDVVGRAFTGEPPSAELWYTGGWAARTGYDPTGIGYHGLGVLTGYTWAEVVQVPALSAAELLDYLDQVTDRLLSALDQMPTEVLHAPAPGLGGTRSRYSRLSAVLQGSFGHVGEIEALKAMRARRLAIRNPHS
jgi:DinB superfamily